MTAALDLDWRVHARCRGADDLDQFFPEIGGDCNLRAASQTAWQYCQPCPVIDRCHQLAERTPASVGIWGGCYRRRVSTGSAKTTPLPLVPAAPKQETT